MNRRRVIWALVSVGVFLIFAVTGYIVSLRQQGESTAAPTIQMTWSQAAEKLGVSAKNLAVELGAGEKPQKNQTLVEYGVTQEQLANTAAHILSHKPAVFKQFIMLGICVFAGLFLMIWGKSDNGKGVHYQRLPYYLALLLTVAASFWLGKSPSPMEGIVKMFKAHAGLYPDVAAKTIGPAVLILFFVVLFNKVICGWACPFGALQELFMFVGERLGLRKLRLPFVVSNSIRGIVFVAFILVLFGVAGNLQGVTIYHYINPFNLFDWKFEYTGIVLCIVISLLGGMIMYRPFCHLVCPMGFISWIFEQFSINRVRVDSDLCVNCGACAEACPANAGKAILEDKKIKPDCFSCMRCLRSCPVGAIRYGLKRKKK